jgi:hypothetical protein
MRKLYLKEVPPNIESLTKGRQYLGQLKPIEYDTWTYQPVPPSYVVICDDGRYRKVKTNFFMVVEDWRFNKLDELGI